VADDKPEVPDQDATAGATSAGADNTAPDDDADTPTPADDTTADTPPKKDAKPAATPAAKDDTAPDDADDTAAQLAAVQAENEALRAQLAKAPEPAPEGGGVQWRSVFSWILVVLAAITVVLGAFAFWLQTTITDEGQFVQTYKDIQREEAVATALSQDISEAFISGGNVETFVANTLPPDLQFLTVPLTEGLRTVTADVTKEILQSDAFAGVWQTVLRLAHEVTLKAIRTEGEIAIDLNEVADEVSSALEERGITVFEGQDIELPTIVLWQSDEIAAASQTLELIETLGWFLPLLALILIGLAIWVSPDRRRTIAALGIGSAIALLVTLVVIDVTKANTVGAIEDDIARPAAVETWETTLRFFVQASWALIVLGLIVGFVAWVVGPSERAQRVRTWWNETIERWRGDDATVPTSGFAGFIATWKRTIQWGAVVLGLLFIILVPDASAWAVIITALVVLVIVAVVEVVGGPNVPPDQPTDDSAADSDQPPAEPVATATSSGDDAGPASDT
jgi:uncharacterized membrane protein